MKRLLPLLMLTPLACNGLFDPGQSIEIPFALQSSDELAAPTPGSACTFEPITASGGGVFKENGFLDLDPNVEPTPGYELALQVENNQSPASDGSHDFHVTDALVTYVAEQSYLVLPAADSKAKFLTSGTVTPGGAATASANLIQTLSPNVINDLQQSLQDLATAEEISSPGGDVDLEIALEGTLGNGQAVTSGTFTFPLHVCIDCFGVNPANCVDGVTAAPSGHGPCCAPQDFSDTCVTCGGVGQPCCALPDAVFLQCQTDSDCKAFGLTAAGDCQVTNGSGSCICQGDADCQSFGSTSTCVQGACTPGCNSGAGQGTLVCTPASSLPAGVENCLYLNSGALTSVCANP